MGNWNVGGGGSSGGGGSFDKDAHEGHLVFAIGVESRPDMQTRFGTSDAAHCAYWGCVDDSTVVEDYLLFGAALVPVVVSDSEAGFDAVCGRLVKGTASGGHSAPWLLETPTAEDQELLSKWLDDHATRLKSGRIVIEPVEPTSSTDDEPF